VLAEIPDPVEAEGALTERLARLRRGARPDPRVISNYEGVVASARTYLKEVTKPAQLRLTLAECVQRALQHNYTIRFEAYNPAISQTYLIEAEAAFDAEFFLDSSYDNRDQATASTFQPGESDTRTIQGGFRKLLPTGMQVSTSLAEQRSKSNIDPQFQTLNPTYGTNFVAAFTQPLLRGFGLEFNRAQINIRRAQRDSAHEQFIQNVRDTVLNVETAYWRLAQVRRGAAILAESVAQNRTTYQSLLDRIDHDVTQVELTNAESRLRSREVEYQETVKNIRDAEDQLKNLLNDPHLKLSEDIEIIPVETPLTAALALDQLAAVRTALDNRSEIRQARLGIDQARIGTMSAKNQTLPQLDLTFQYEVQGLADTGDNSWDNMAKNRFISYTVKATFSYPFGNRAREAAYTRARLQEQQAVVGLHRVTDGVVQEVNGAVRVLQVRYAQIPPQLEAVSAAERNLRALQARTQRIDPLYLDNELGAVERLAAARSTLMQVIADYNIAVVALEKAKGTLLQYNNIVVTDEAPKR
jgi:outer membrane protein